MTNDQERADEAVVTVRSLSYATKKDVDNPGRSMLIRRGSFRRCTVADLIDWCHANNKLPTDVEVSGGSLNYRDLETEAEQADRLERVAQVAARHEQWERDTFERLSAKFGPAAGVTGSPE